MVNNKILKTEFKKLFDKILDVKYLDGEMLNGIQPKMWVMAGNKSYLFKYSRDHEDYSDFGEVFTSYLSYLLGFKCVTSIFSRDRIDESNKFTGVLIESYLTKNVTESISLKRLIDVYKRRHFSGHTVKEALEICKEFCEDKNLILDKNLEQELKEMALMDYLLIQIDRHAHNIEFLIEEKDGVKTLKLAPMFDNGYCLFLEREPFRVKKILKNYNENEGINSLTTNYINPRPYFYIEESEEVFKEYENIISDLASEILRNPPLKKLYENFKNLNFKTEVEFINSIYPKKLPLVNKNLILKSVNNRIKMLDLEITKKLIKQNLNKEECKNECGIIL